MLNINRALLLLIIMIVSAAGVLAQQPKPTSQNSSSAADSDDENTVNPRQPSISNPADFLKPGALQIEYGYSGYYRGSDFRAQDSGTLTVSYAANDFIGFEADITTFTSQKDLLRHRESSIGDINLGVQFDLVKESKKHPGFAMSYYTKLPAASAEKGLGSGRVDHEITALVSKKVKETEIDFNATYLINGREQAKGFETGGQYALGFSRDFHKKFNLAGEIFGETKDAGDPQGLFADGIFTYYLSSKAAFDVGARFGLTHDSPRTGFTAGITYAFDSFLKKETK